MRVEKLKGANLGNCEAGDCTKPLSGGTSIRRGATHRVTMAGYNTSLCAAHAAEWERIYNRALGILDDMKAAA